MASSSGTTTTTTTTTSAMMTSSEGSASEELQLQVRMEQKKRRRMQSNRESARRSRVRKQQHLDRLTEQAGALGAENARVIAAVNVAARNYAAVEAENSVLRTQLLELSSRLSSLNEIVHYINDQQQPLYMNQNNNNNNNYINNYDNSNSNSFFMSNNNSWNNNNLGYMNQHPIMASADHVLHYY